MTYESRKGSRRDDLGNQRVSKTTSFRSADGAVNEASMYSARLLESSLPCLRTDPPTQEESEVQATTPILHELRAPGGKDLDTEVNSIGDDLNHSIDQKITWTIADLVSTIPYEGL
jgi:hypothetical protein